MSTSAPPRLVLASSSPARRRLLEGAGFDPTVVVSGADETFPAGLPTGEAVALLAARKLEAVLDRCQEAVTVACDSMLEVEGRPLGRPPSRTAAGALWERLSGRSATLFTGHCLVDTRSGRRAEATASTLVRFGRPSEVELDALLATGEPTAVAGGFTIDGFSGPFVESLEGSWSNVLGLCLPTFRRLLAEIGVPLVALWRPLPGR